MLMALVRHLRLLGAGERDVSSDAARMYALGQLVGRVRTSGQERSPYTIYYPKTRHRAAFYEILLFVKGIQKSYFSAC